MAIQPFRSIDVRASSPKVFFLPKSISTNFGHNITLRHVTPEDESFLRGEYAGARQEELSLLHWDDSMKESFLDMQFNAQHSRLHSVYPDADYLVLLEDAVPAGRLYINLSDNHIHIMEIAILPESMGRGTGAALPLEIHIEGERADRTVSIADGPENAAVGRMDIVSELDRRVSNLRIALRTGWHNAYMCA